MKNFARYHPFIVEFTRLVDRSGDNELAMTERNGKLLE